MIDTESELKALWSELKPLLRAGKLAAVQVRPPARCAAAPPLRLKMPACGAGA